MLENCGDTKLNTPSLSSVVTVVGVKTGGNCRLGTTKVTLQVLVQHTQPQVRMTRTRSLGLVQNIQ